MRTAIVIPCFNEEDRLDLSSLQLLLEEEDVELILVDDGSADGTREKLHSVKDQLGDRVQVTILAENVGKAEAVRKGMNLALALGARHIGYLDADFATPATEMIRLLNTLRHEPAVHAVLGSRWLHMGASIERSSFRHYAGRVFATFASNILRMPVYDTQCGAKVFSVTPLLEASLREPFTSSWAFDVELLGRLRYGCEEVPGYHLREFREVPLKAWRDVRGSKMRLRDMMKATLELFVIGLRLKQHR
ncbi:MAG: glycosyltransferase [Pseudomonadales bacterium]|nr:glycosyltransferase [Pseudomonadales bacterium]